ncbi:hypothetical protein GLOTRDRAFT_69073 [Gloeophyllum trabeum ATCC 11539]|uniref:SET domain-containing protein n=1 Tax=Gloeophyllum trabeum (strain ATCC 11539 / FP-39264 / Madison 617) TaxID=670483 RepID=S7QNA2_GLOTA|nr:uncharacterized protein GLOTRDRAFT_69073 [Gloeophyllum trabeum ATCC 11539]EPQ60978.1 hypothetical protein GLOTRDRAFT_69073 [Gloeophyllum trabeum ATCC 11539]
MTAKPTNWPTNVQYIPQQCYHSSVPLEALSYIRGPLGKNASLKSTNNGRSSSVIIRTITDPSHPAVGQCGLFAAKKIPPNTHIIDYSGEVHGDDRDSDYDLSLYRTQDGLSIGIDALSFGNEARFINDYRGIRSKPNAVFQDRRTDAGELRMSVWSTSLPIKKGQEILVSYGKGWWKARFNDGVAEPHTA